MNLRFAHVQKSLSSAPVQSCCPQRALFQVYISYSMQKGQASSCKMYTRGEIFIEICRFLVKLQAFCRILTKPEASAIFFTDSGTKPGARTEARVLHPLSTAALTQRCSAKPTGGLCVLPSYFYCYRHHEGVCRWLVSRADLFFVWPKEEAFYENEPPFHHPQPRAGCTVPCTGLCAAHDHWPCAAGGQHAVPDALSHSAVRLCAGRPMGPCRGLHCSAGAVGAVRHAAHVPHRHCHGL